MKIGIDARLWSQTGVGRYIRNLVSNLENLDKKNEYVLFVRKEDEKEIKSIIHNSNFIIQLADIPWHSIDEQVRFPKILNEQNLDLVHFPYFSVPFFYGKPYIITVHDLIVGKFATGKASTLPYPVYMTKRLGYSVVMANAVNRAKKIITPSNAVKDDLLLTYRNLNQQKISVIYEGGFEDKLKVQSKKFKVKELGKYVLRVGNFYPHKNVEGLILAFSSLVSEYENKDLKLVLVGPKDYFYGRIEKLIEEKGTKDKVEFIEKAKDEELALLYRNAQVSIVPSFMEGFSLTAIEAASQGLLVIASDIPVHREIMGKAAIYCNPNDINDIKQKINLALNLAPDSKKELISEGEKQAKKYSWEKMAKETLDIYNKLAWGMSSKED